MNSIHIRRVAADEFPAVMTLVDDVFTGEQGIPAWMNPLPAEKQPQWWCAQAQDCIVGTAAAYFSEGKCHVGRIAVSPDKRGMGIGTRMLRLVLAELFAQGIESVYMEARDATVRILGRMGAEIAGEPFPFYGADCTPIVLHCRNFREE